MRQDLFQITVGANNQNVFTYDISNSYLTLYNNPLGASGGLQITTAPTNAYLKTIEMWIRVPTAPGRISYLFDNSTHTAIWYATPSGNDVIGSFWANSVLYINGDAYTVTPAGGTPKVFSKIAGNGWAQIVIVPDTETVYQLPFPMYFFYSSSSIYTTTLDIAEVSFYNTYLTSTQVRTQYSSKVSRYGIPDMPTSLTASLASGSSTLSMGWSASAGPTPTGYIVYIYEVGTVNTTYTQTVSGTTSTYTSCLDSYSYYFAVSAINASGRSGQSTPYSPSLSCTLALTAPVPNAPTITGSTLTMTWTAGAGGAPTSYDVEIYEGATLKTTQTSITGTSTTYSSLTNGQIYKFKVRAYNTATPSGIISSLSSGITYTTNSPPNAPTVNAPTNSGSTLTMTWTIGTGGLPTQYDIYVLGNGSAVTHLTVTGVPPTTTKVYSPMTGGVAYSFYVTATNTSGTSSASSTSSTVTYNPPLAPTPDLPTIVGTSLSMTWTAGGGGTPTYYTVYVLENLNLVATLDNITDLSTTYSPLVNGSFYAFYLTATNLSGTSSSSSTTNPNIQYTAGSPPSAPTIGGISNSGTTLTLRWSAGAGGDTPTGFIIHLYSSAVAKTNSFVEIGSSPFTIPSPSAISYSYVGTAGLYYRFYVVAYNDSGNSSSSSYSSVLQIPFS